MASVRGFDQPHPMVRQQRRSRGRQHSDKGIVERVNDQRRHGYLRRDPGTGRAIVIIIRAGESRSNAR